MSHGVTAQATRLSQVTPDHIARRLCTTDLSNWILRIQQGKTPNDTSISREMSMENRGGEIGFDFLRNHI